jgi:cobalt-zinc-cadmium efflux system membrane fusion protein
MKVVRRLGNGLTQKEFLMVSLDGWDRTRVWRRRPIAWAFVRGGAREGPSRMMALAMLVGLALARSAGHAHEGHAPLPTTGVEVDGENGILTLSPEAKAAIGLQTAPVETKALEESVLAYATLMTPWPQQHFVSSLLPGRIAALHVRTGDSVESGQLLAEIASADLDSLQLELRTAENSLRLSSRQAKILKDLAERSAVSGREAIEAAAQAQKHESALRSARSKLRSLGISDAAIDQSLAAASVTTPLLIPIVSPIRGVVSHTDLAMGKVVGAGEHLFEVNDLARLWVKIGVLERDIFRIKAGQPVTLAFPAYPSEPVEARVSIAPVAVDPVSHVATAWAELTPKPGGPRWLPGMHGTATIVTSEPTPLVTVPASAVLGSGAERYVLVEIAATSKGYEYRRQNVVVAAHGSAVAQIRPGSLYPGDQVVSVGGHVLSSFFILGSLRLSPEGIRNVGLKVAPVGAHVVEQVLAVDGLIDGVPGSAATVSSSLGGTLSRLRVGRGEHVKAGQVLAEVKGLPLQDTQLTMLTANLEAGLLSDMLARLTAHGQMPDVAMRRIWEMENARDAAVLRRDSARQTLLTMGMSADEVDGVVRTGQTLSALPIRSPIDGVFIDFDKVLGESVSPDEPLFEIHDLSRPLAKAFLSEAEAAKVAIGTRARVRLLADPLFLAEGTVVRSARLVGAQDRTLVVWIEFKSDDQRPLPRNLLARISATLGTPEPTLAVPLSAVVREQTRHYVFVQKQGGLLERRPIEIGRSDDRFIEVRHGLEIGETIAIQGTSELQTTYASVR